MALEDVLKFLILCSGVPEFSIPQKALPALPCPSSTDDVIEGIRQELRTSDGQKTLSAGFNPERFNLYRMVESL